MIQNKNPVSKSAIPSGAIGALYEAKNPKKLDEPLFTIKTNSIENPHQFDPELWNTIQEFNFKPSSIANCYGVYKENPSFSKQTDIKSLMIYDFFPKTLKNVMEERTQKQNEYVPFQTLKKYFKTIVNSLAFCQNDKISHQGLEFENIFLEDVNSNNIYLMDFTIDHKFESSFSLKTSFKNKLLF